MSFFQTETEYGMQHKRSDYRLRQAPEEKEKKEEGHRRYPMEGYEASERELRQRTEPTQQVLLKGGGRRFSAGYNKEQKLTMAFSRDKGEGRVREEEVFRAEESVADGISPEYMRTGPCSFAKNAQILEDRREKQKSYLLRQLESAADTAEKSLLADRFSFLSTAKEKEKIQVLEEEARAHSTERALTEADRQQAAVLRRDVLHKEEEQRNLLEVLTVRMNPEKEKGKKSSWTPTRLSSTALPTEEADGDAQEGMPPEDSSFGENLPQK